jgi:hypothetical protein
LDEDTIRPKGVLGGGVLVLKLGREGAFSRHVGQPAARQQRLPVEADVRKDGGRARAALGVPADRLGEAGGAAAVVGGHLPHRYRPGGVGPHEERGDYLLGRGRAVAFAVGVVVAGKAGPALEPEGVDDLGNEGFVAAFALVLQQGVQAHFPGRRLVVVRGDGQLVVEHPHAAHGEGRVIHEPDHDVYVRAGGYREGQRQRRAGENRRNRRGRAQLHDAVRIGPRESERVQLQGAEAFVVQAHGHRVVVGVVGRNGGVGAAPRFADQREGKLVGGREPVEVFHEQLGVARLGHHHRKVYRGGFGLVVVAVHGPGPQGVGTGRVEQQGTGVIGVGGAVHAVLRGLRPDHPHRSGDGGQHLVAVRTGRHDRALQADGRYRRNQVAVGRGRVNDHVVELGIGAADRVDGQLAVEHLYRDGCRAVHLHRGGGHAGTGQHGHEVSDGRNAFHIDLVPAVAEVLVTHADGHVVEAGGRHSVFPGAGRLPGGLHEDQGPQAQFGRAGAFAQKGRMVLGQLRRRVDPAVAAGVGVGPAVVFRVAGGASTVVVGWKLILTALALRPVTTRVTSTVAAVKPVAEAVTVLVYTPGSRPAALTANDRLPTAGLPGNTSQLLLPDLVSVRPVGVPLLAVRVTVLAGTLPPAVR